MIYLSRYNILMGFTKERYEQEKLVRVTWTGENIQSRVFEECEFDSCSFKNCKFSNCKFLNCTFTDCDLSSIIPMACNFTEVRFVRCKVIGVDWTKTQKIQELSFSECSVNYSNFRLLKLPKIKMVKCEAKEVDFIEADLSGGDLKNTDFDKSVFFKTNLTNADLRNATNYAIDITTNIIKKARFSLPEAVSLLSALDIIID